MVAPAPVSKQANAIGRSAKTVREFLEKHYSDETAASDTETIKLAIKVKGIFRTLTCRTAAFRCSLSVPPMPESGSPPRPCGCRYSC